MALTFKIHFGRLMRRFGYDTDDRARRKARNIFSFMAVAQKDKNHVAARKIMSVYMMNWSLRHSMATKVLKYAGSVHNVLLRFEWSHTISRLRLEALRTTIWQKQLMKLCSTLTALKNEKQQRLWQTIVKIEERSKSFIILAYDYRQRHGTKLRFMKWFVEKEELKDPAHRSKKFGLY
mmetsp:Transcript_31306/g.47904  ORF Transcript_31306/g.47904 Transcript_31306/m.47904 type:complete len:178 (-) Transcript_31306:462-995(-)|eukprot:CAMPEP_0170511796 /NCGR_PEP_ID=MMETSP0208-20121228/66500_1 /TAXON_ID=197538 /ORGANISM="Strombidium inclinatum, Strain S3" /LENGTH=177 /DNA_ID=CAMNT_0010795363 /DNA_START=797 /DNA_END=1330 /DNA_ORIENTATION=-